ncbi:MAG: LysR family transcriptional regulator [Hyphomicrobiales bacterium]|nr:MAG: LysR family transcriptional regulator [Hyphomicrobiales bacterium]
MPNWTLKQLESFVWVAKLGSFRGTAERLNTTQPNISVRISQLEASLGVRLFHRDSGSVALTPIGHSLLSHAEKVLQASEEFSQQSIRSDQQVGILRLGVTELIAQTWLRDYLLALRQVFPNIDVELKVELTVNLREELVSRALDLCLLNGPISNFNITNVDLGSVPYLWVASPRLGLTGSEIGAFASHTILTHARNTRHFVELSAHFRDSFEQPVRIVPSSNLAASLQMTLDGLGIAPMSRTLVEKYIDSGELVEFPYEWKPTALIFTASYAHTPASFLLKRAAELAGEQAASQHHGNRIERMGR